MDNWKATFPIWSANVAWIKFIKGSWHKSTTESVLHATLQTATNQKCTPFVFSCYREGFVWDSQNMSTSTWTSWVCAPWRNNSNYNQKFSHRFVWSGENWYKESSQRHNRWNVFASKFDSTSSPHSERFGTTYIDKSPKMTEQRVYFVFGTYNSPCLKDITRDIRGDDLDDSDEIYSFGSGQMTPSNFVNLLKYSNFKKAFFALLLWRNSKEWVWKYLWW